MGRAWVKSPDQRLIWNTTSEGRIQGTRMVLRDRLWASPEDPRMFLFGWELEWEYGVRTFGYPGEESIECIRSLVNLTSWRRQFYAAASPSSRYQAWSVNPAG